MSVYVLVHTKDLRGVRLLVQKDTANWLVWLEVNKWGEEIVPKGYDCRTHVIDRQAILRLTPLVMNNHYGELEPVEEATA